MKGDLMRFPRPWRLVDDGGIVWKIKDAKGRLIMTVGHIPEPDMRRAFNRLESGDLGREDR